MADWQPIETAPLSGEFLAEIQFRFYKGYLVLHWGHSDGDGEQPTFGPGWFYHCGEGYAELPSTWKILRWKSISE